MPSGALNEFECTVDAASNNRHPTHFQSPSIVDVCWQQRDSRPGSPIRCSDSRVSTNGNDPSTKPAPKEDDGGGDDLGTQSNTRGNRPDELVKIKEGFDTWLAAFRKSRPHRDVIWRVGKKEGRTRKSVLTFKLFQSDQPSIC